MRRKAPVKTTPKQRRGHLVLSQTQAGLALGVVTMGLIVAFGFGFVVGMWYEASDQITPYDAELDPVPGSGAQDRAMTFYSTLEGSGKEAASSSRGATHMGSRSAFASGIRYSVQVGSFRVQEQAERLHRRLLHKGYDARILLSRLPGKGVWYRVRVGKFPDQTAADRMARRLVSQEHLSVMITHELR